MSVKSHLAAWRSKTPEPDAPQQPVKPPSACIADGCPLPGVYRQSDSASLCCVHEGEDAHKWPQQTERVNECAELFGMALRMTNALAGETPSERLVERVKSLGGSEPKAKTVRGYGMQIRGELMAHCKGPNEVPADAKRALDSWQKLNAA